MFKNVHKVEFDKEKFRKNLKVFGSYFHFLFKVVVRDVANWMMFVTYVFILSLILLIVPAILDSSPVDYWNNPIVQISSFVLILVACLNSSLSLNLFRDGIDSGIELIIISKPISRINFVLAKYSMFLVFLLSYSLVSIIIGLLTFTIPKMDPVFVGDLIGGLFTGTFIIGLFFGSLSILISLKYGKNTTNMIIILIAILLNFLTPLSSLFFETPYKVLQNKGVNLVQSSIKTRDNQFKNIIYQSSSSFGSSNEEFKDVKQEYQLADQQTFYSKSFYINFGSMIGSLYNLGSLAPYHNANILVSPNNTTWNFIETIKRDDFPNITAGLPSSNNLSLTSGLNEKIILLQKPSSSASLFNSLFNRSAPKYTFVSNPSTNELTTILANDELYKKSEDVNEIKSSLNNASNSLAQLLDENSTLVNGIVDDINSLDSPQMFNNKIIQDLTLLVSANNVTLYKQNYEQNYNQGSDNKTIAENVFTSKLCLFYGFDNLINWNPNNSNNSPKLYDQFISDVINNNKFAAINNPNLSNDLVWTVIDQNLNSNFKWYETLKNQIIPDENSSINDQEKLASRNKIIGATLQVILANQVSASYLIDGYAVDQKNTNYRISLGLIPLNAKQLDKSYIVQTVPIIDPTIIVIIMVIIAFSLFVSIGFIYYYEDIR